MKHTFKYIAMLFGFALSMTACDDMFNTDPDNIVNEEDYISNENEMYRGFLGIITKMQTVGDQAIYLTDTRCDYLETTGNAPIALQNINNYEETDGNEYADPTSYYDVIVTCNDFIKKIGEYYVSVDGAMSDSAKMHYPQLISSAVRIKVWAYYMLGRIYGEAYWYDDDLTSLENLNNTSVFTKMDMAALSAKCLDVLDNGITVNGRNIASNLVINWQYWVDPVNGNESYAFWQHMTPEWLILRAEIASWHANYVSDEEAKQDWAWIRENILVYLNTLFSAGNTDYYSCTMTTTLHYYEMFFTEEVGYEQELITGIFYDYKNGQKNKLVQYFCPAYPDDGFYLSPSKYALDNYSQSDLRGPVQQLNSSTISGETCFSKYYYHRGSYLRSNIFEIEPTIILYRGHDYHFLLAEAENHLGHWEVAATLLNKGILNRFPGGYITMPTDSLNGQRIWSPYYQSWFASAGGYGDIGIVGCVRGAEHDTTGFSTMNEAERIKAMDLLLADEYLKEYTGEGKSYSYLCKMAERYQHDYAIIYDRIKGKYEDLGIASKVKTSLESKYFINWNLEVE